MYLIIYQDDFQCRQILSTFFNSLFIDELSTNLVIVLFNVTDGNGL